MIDLATLPFVQAQWYTSVPEESPRPVTLIVVHAMEAPQKPHTALDVAHYFAAGSEGRPASAHFCVDGGMDRPAVHCVQLRDVAYGAPGANHNGAHIEHAGYTAQSARDWSDAYSQKMLRLSAQIAAALCRRYGIPARWLSPGQVAARARGITSHANVTVGLRALYPNATHLDPGDGFPSGHYVQQVQAALDAES